MAKLITILANVWSEPQTIVYPMMFQRSERDENEPCCSINIEKQTKDSAASFLTSQSNESAKTLYTKPNVQTKSVQSGSGLKRYRSANSQCGVPYKKLRNKSVHFINSQHKRDCKVGPSLVTLKNDAQTDSTQYRICEAHREVFQILTNWPQHAENSKLRKKNSTSYYDCVKNILLSIGKALVIEKIKLPTYPPPEEQIMKVYKCLSLESVTPKKEKMSVRKENKMHKKPKGLIKTKTKCSPTQTDEVI